MSDQDLWNLADSLGIVLEVDDDRLLRTTAQKELVFGSLRLAVPLNVVSSALTKDGAVVLCRSLGNVALLAVTRYKQGAPASIFVINIAKMKARPEGCIEKMNPSRPQEVVELFEKQGAIVRTFHKANLNTWQEQVKAA